MNLVCKQWYDEFPVSIVPSYYHHASAVCGGGRFEGERFVRETKETWRIGKTEKARHKRDKRDPPHKKDRQQGREKDR
jgi:hypothetical protein